MSLLSLMADESKLQDDVLSSDVLTSRSLGEAASISNTNPGASSSSVYMTIQTFGLKLLSKYFTTSQDPRVRIDIGELVKKILMITQLEIVLSMALCHLLTIHYGNIFEQKVVNHVPILEAKEKQIDSQIVADIRKVTFTIIPKAVIVVVTDDLDIFLAWRCAMEH